MANKLIQIKDGSDNLYPAMYKETLTGTTGTSLYQGYYYVDLTLTKNDRGHVVSAFVYNTQSNRPAFAQSIASNTVRVFCPNSSTDVTVNVWYG